MDTRQLVHPYYDFYGSGASGSNTCVPPIRLPYILFERIYRHLCSVVRHLGKLQTCYSLTIVKGPYADGLVHVKF